MCVSLTSLTNVCCYCIHTDGPWNLQKGLSFNAAGHHTSVVSEDLLKSFDYTIAMDGCDSYYSYQLSISEEDKKYDLTLNQHLPLTEDSRHYDIIGTNIIWDTLQESDGFKTKLPWRDYSPAQNFFLLLAQEFCSEKKIPETFISFYEDNKLPVILRLRNMFANSKQFGHTFNCNVGSTMNNEFKCPPFPKYREDMVKKKRRREVSDRSQQISESPESLDQQLAKLLKPVGQQITFEPVDQQITVSPEPVSQQITVSPEPVGQQITVSPEPVGQQITVLPEPVGQQITVSPKPEGQQTTESEFDYDEFKFS